LTSQETQSTWKELQQQKIAATTAKKKNPSPTLPEEGSGDKKRQACLKAFKDLHWQWKACNKQFKGFTVAKHFRKQSSLWALYLMVINKELYAQATKELRKTGCALPSPLDSEFAQTACNPTFTPAL
jgi:hypothetical protein